jgi:anti-anti-sigma factor
VRAVVIVGLVLGGLTRSVRPRRPHRSDLRTPDRRRRWGAALRCARHDALPAAVALPAHAPAPPGTIALLEENGVRVMVLSGEIDVGTVQAFEARTGSARPAPSPATSVAVADVTAVTFIDCDGLSFLVRCTQAVRASGRRPLLRGPTPPVERVLRLTGLTALFDTDPHRR